MNSKQIFEYYTNNPELIVMLDGQELENTVGFSNGDSGGYYHNGYNVLEGYECIYIKTYTVFQGTVELEDNIKIARNGYKIIHWKRKMFCFSGEKDILDQMDEKETLDNLRSLITKSERRKITKAVQGLIESGDHPEGERELKIIEAISKGETPKTLDACICSYSIRRAQMIKHSTSSIGPDEVICGECHREVKELQLYDCEECDVGECDPFNQNDGEMICDKCKMNLGYIENEGYCECSFPTFIINDGIQSCSKCCKTDHYKSGIVDDHSEDEKEGLCEVCIKMDEACQCK